MLETRPVYHASDAIRGHLFTSFVALVLRKELQDRLQRILCQSRGTTFLANFRFPAPPETAEIPPFFFRKRRQNC